MGDKSNVAVVIGASGGIGIALVESLLNDSNVDEVIAISRNVPVLKQRFEQIAHSSSILHFIESDYSEASVQQVCQTLESAKGRIKYLSICNGVLHGENFQPERRIEELEEKNLLRLFTANAIVPMRWLKYFKPLLKGKSKTSIAVLSARVGSIRDNRLGGWYSYRSSKSALNMLLKTLSIEFARTHKNVQFYAFHPGTTDTSLSKPFQARVPQDKLFEPAFVAQQLLKLLTNENAPGEIQFVDWQHKLIEW